VCGSVDGPVAKFCDNYGLKCKGFLDCVTTLTSQGLSFIEPGNEC
jgi:hypothetical protein